MYMSSRRQRNPPAHHHQYFCLHHDQLMTDIAAINTMKAAAAADIATDFRICELKDNMPMATAGSKHLSIRYGARVSESKRCQFCLASPCKANLEIQVKFNEVRVSLDWILSGFVPDIKKKSPLQARGPGQVPAA
ncbi:hypothetical protein BGZ58_000789 [Dissophora ornata]|nr:hypothetical protein BGZ58_000789 [Dissophora ornata]